jgi:hypothetical protein
MSRDLSSSEAILKQGVDRAKSTQDIEQKGSGAVVLWR